MNNLFPPVIDTYMPHFVGDVARVYFSLSSYNVESDIKYTMVTVTDSNTGRTVLSQNLYPMGIKVLKRPQKDNQRKTDDKYFIDITGADLQANTFGINKYYKVQIRFANQNTTNCPTAGAKGPWLEQNLDKFSEWSSVCLIRKIAQPRIELTGMSGETYSHRTMTIVGKLVFSNKEETEVLRNYQIRLTNETTMSTAHLSEVITTSLNNKNVINYEIPILLANENIYTLKITYSTKGGYSGEYNKTFQVNVGKEEKLNLDFTAEPDIYQGHIELKIDYKKLLSDAQRKDEQGVIIIRRSSSDKNFAYWEDIFSINITPNEVIESNRIGKYFLYDTSIKSGVWYKYCLQYFFTNPGSGRKTTSELKYAIRKKELEKGKTSATPVMIVFEDMYLLGEKIQLKVAFDPKVQSLKYNTVDSVTQTIGSKYPYVRRNADVGYKTFQVSGLISRHIDEDDSVEIYKNHSVKELYEKYNEENNITRYNDFIYEKMFRDKVLDFLQDGKPKLFRSTQEGNILVKLTDVNITPNEVLSRMIYSFTATATEIGEDSTENLEMYNLQNIKATPSYSFILPLYIFPDVDKNFLGVDDVTGSVFPHSDAAHSDAAAQTKNKIVQIAKLDTDIKGNVTYNFDYTLDENSTDKEYLGTSSAPGDFWKGYDNKNIVKPYVTFIGAGEKDELTLMIEYDYDADGTPVLEIG